MNRSVGTVADILEFKGPAVITTKSSDTVGTLSRRLQQYQISAMIISDDGQTVLGIISERDVAYGLALYRGELHALPVSALMTKKAITCSPEDSLADVTELMGERRIRHLPVTDGKKLVGVIGMRDILMQRLKQMQRTTRLMGNFIIASP